MRPTAPPLPGAAGGARPGEAALRGVGEVSGLFTTRLLRLTDLPVRDKGDGPTRVVELVLVIIDGKGFIHGRATAQTPVSRDRLRPEGR